MVSSTVKFRHRREFQSRSSSIIQRKRIRMPAAIDLTNQKFGRLTVVELTERNKHGQRLWRCECECGGKATVRVSSLRTGSTTSCGCLQRLKCYQGTAALKHGHTGKNRRTPEYQAWGSLR